MLTADVTGGGTVVMTTRICVGSMKGEITRTEEGTMAIINPGPISQTSAVSILIFISTFFKITKNINYHYSKMLLIFKI